jgi:hypothetical protein
MTPKEKAIELVEKMMLYSYEKIENEIFSKYIVNNEIKKELAKQCALIAVDEIFNSVDNEHVSDIFNQYWQEVKNEIEKL